MEGDDHVEAYTAIIRGVGLSHEILEIAGAEAVAPAEGNMCGAVMRGTVALPVRGTDEESDGCVVLMKHRLQPTEIGGGGGGGKAAGRRERKLQHMLRTQCRAQYDTEAASLRIGGVQTHDRV